MIYCIGNSHANFFTGTDPPSRYKGERGQFVSKSIGPIIAYNFKNNHFPKVIDFLEWENIDKSENYVMLVVGEVDCRWHLPKQAQINQRCELETTRECVDRFFECICDLRALGYHMIGWGGHPSTTASHSDDPYNPIFGDCFTRNRISLEWSRYLGERCLENSIPFLSIIEDLIDENGLTRMEYFRDYCHLGENAFTIMEKQLLGLLNG